MEQKIEQVLTVPYVAYEAELERADRKNRRLWIALTTVLIGITALFIGAITCRESID